MSLDQSMSNNESLNSTGIASPLASGDHYTDYSVVINVLKRTKYYRGRMQDLQWEEGGCLS